MMRVASPGTDSEIIHPGAPTTNIPVVRRWLALTGRETAMPRKLLTSAAGISFVVHVAILFLFGLIQYSSLAENVPILLETVFSEERQQEEFSQELDIDTTVSDNLNPVAGGVVTGAVGQTAAPSISTTRIETSESLKEPVLAVNVREFALPGENLLGEDLGETSVKGETGAVVEGYGAAMSRLTRELLRMMRESKVMVVWLFDESESMKDDQQKISEQFHKVYEELGIAAREDATLKSRRGRGNQQDEVLLTSIVSYGENIHYVLETPSANINEIRGAIDNIEIDDSGVENTSQAVAQVVSKYRVMAGRQDRRLVLVVVTDESGDDGQFIEEAVNEVKRAKAPVYVLGREAVFGYPYARMRWVDPKYGLSHWIRVNRGPETAAPEALQWNGFGRRYDVFQSGFGSYELVRLAKESGGIYFLLPGEEETLSGPGANDRRKFDFLAMKEYEPRLESRLEYEQKRARSSKFRARIWDVISRLNPYQDDQLDLRQWWYPADPAEFAVEGKKNFDKAVRSLALANQALAILEEIEPERAREESWRWRAAYDLMRAQVPAYRVRLYQFLLVLDKHVKEKPMPKEPPNNTWTIRIQPEMLPPDPVQAKASKVDLEELERQKKRAEELFQFVIDEHPGTPWARRAERELQQGFGVRLEEDYRDPNYDADDIELPKL